MSIKKWVDRMPTRLPEGLLNCALVQMDAMNAEIDELRSSLAALKVQEPVGYAYAHQDYIGSVIGAKGQWAPDEIPLFLAAGAEA